jgi:ABC-2 type transport system permease protein
MRFQFNNSILTIARKELLELTRDGRFRWLIGVVSITLLASLFAGWRCYAEARTERELAQAQERERWLGKGEMSGHSAAHYGVFVFKPDSALSAIDQGVSPYTGTAVFLEAHSRNPFAYRPASDTPAARRYGELTAAAVLQIFAPLLIILLCYPVFAGEREQGTLRQVLSLGVSSRSLAVGKMLGAVVPLFLVLAPLAFIGVVALALYAGAEFTSGIWLRLWLMTLTYLAYFIVFIGAALTVSAVTSSSRQAFVLLLAFWFANCLALPQVVSDVAGRIYPAIDGYELPAAIANARANLPTREQRLPEIEKRLLAQYGVGKVEDLPVDPKRVALIEIDAEGDKIQERYFNALHDAYEKQDQLYQWGAIFAPMMAAQSLSMSLAGTHFAYYRRFADAADAYRQELVHTMDQADLYSAGAIPNSGASIRHDRETWEMVPPFDYRPPTLAWALGKSIISIVILTLWFGGILFITPLALLRLKVD